MRLFAVTAGGELVEYQEEAFREEHREETVESWLASNPDCISEEDSLLIIGRQVSTNLYTAIDLLAVDGEGDTAVIELKRDSTPRATLAQALEYASFVEQLDYSESRPMTDRTKPQKVRTVIQRSNDSIAYRWELGPPLAEW